MSSNRSLTGKSPLHDRALELLRGGMPAVRVANATGIAPAIIKRWGRAAGIRMRPATAEDFARIGVRRQEATEARRAHGMGITAEKRR